MIAAELGMSVWRAQEEIDSAEFIDWVGFLHLKNNPDLLSGAGDIHISQIARMFTSMGIGRYTEG